MKRKLIQLSILTALLVVVGSACRAQGPDNAGQQPALSVRDQFRQLLNKDRRPVPLAPQTLTTGGTGEVRTERVRFQIEQGQQATAVITRPAAPGKYPAVIVQHYLGGSKDVFLFATLLNGLAQKGMIGVAIDGRYRGERENGKNLHAAMSEALRTGKGHPWLIDTAYDVLKLVDYLQTRPDVDPARIGMSGFSEGGIITWMCAAADDRIKVAAPIIGVTCFADALQEADSPAIQAKLKLFQPVLDDFAKSQNEAMVNGRLLRAAWERLIPGSLDRFDGPSLVPEIAPRPLLIQNHEQDEIIPVIGARKVHAVLEKRYRDLNASDRLDFRVAPGLTHTNIPALLSESSTMVKWMDRWLRTAPN